MTNIKYQRSRIKKIIFLFLIGFICLNLVGCDAFVRKFTRKPKKDQYPQEELVLAPVEYKAPSMTPEQKYRQTFLYWQSWLDELIEALSSPKKRKKALDCAGQALKNLDDLRPLLDEKDQLVLDKYATQLNSLKEEIQGDIYSNRLDFSRSTAERIRRNVFRDLSISKVKGSLK